MLFKKSNVSLIHLSVDQGKYNECCIARDDKKLLQNGCCFDIHTILAKGYNSKWDPNEIEQYSNDKCNLHSSGL